MQERKQWQCNGVLIVLDVLGWQAGKSALSKRWQMVTDMNTAFLPEILQSNASFKGVNCVTGVFETDSYLIGAWRDSREIDAGSLAFASIFANGFFAASWREALPLRGALSIGEFTASSDLKVSGIALSDVRSEFDILNWVGCHATETATNILDGIVPKYKVLKKSFVAVADPPYKALSVLGQRWVLNWVYAFFRQPEERAIREIMQKELGSAKADRDKAKYERCIRFFEKVHTRLEELENKQNSTNAQNAP
jgi:hypothetical protein